MTDMLREVSSSIDNLAMGRIPHYLIPLKPCPKHPNFVGPASPIQTHLAFSWGSAIPLCVDPEAGDLAFLLSLPIIDSNSIYRLKGTPMSKSTLLKSLRITITTSSCTWP